MLANVFGQDIQLRVFDVETNLFETLQHLIFVELVVGVDVEGAENGPHSQPVIL